MTLWRWPSTPEQLAEEQDALAEARVEPWRVPESWAALAIGACVVVFPRGLTGAGARGDAGWAAAAVVRAGAVLARSVTRCRAGAPYVPGLLALREGPCLLGAVQGLAAPPDVLLVDATGRDHPRRAGLALHLGAVLGVPTVGITHRPLYASGAWPDDVRGAASPLTLDGSVVGAWVRTRAGARPLAVHAAWRTDVATAVAVALVATRDHRTPEPFRVARRLAREARAARADEPPA